MPALVAGVAVVAGTAFSALFTFVVPRPSQLRLYRVVFLIARGLFAPFLAGARRYEARDRILAAFAPITLLMLPVLWLLLLLAGFGAMFWAAEDLSVSEAFQLSGSSLLTLGFHTPTGSGSTALAISEATLGVGLLALLITYLPTIYAAFGRRETVVALLEVRAGDPPAAENLISRFQAIHGMEHLDDLWSAWEAWFADLDESHTSIAALPHLRSPQAQHSWVTAAGAILDAAALRSSTLDMRRESRAELCIRAGYIALRRIADLYGIEHDHDPEPTDPISVDRGEFDAVCERLDQYGVPLRSDRDQAWQDFAGWRVNYDVVLRALAGLTLAPPAPWSSDRAIPYRTLQVLRRPS